MATQSTALPRQLDVLLSSRCATSLRCADGTTATMTEVREKCKVEIEKLLPYGNSPTAFRVWINESSEANDIDDDWYEVSQQRAATAHIVIVLFSGDAGSTTSGHPVGVCHAEFDAAVADAPAKVRVVDARG